MTVGLSRVGYWKVTLVILRMYLERDLTPSSGPGSGKTNLTFSLVRAK